MCHRYACDLKLKNMNFIYEVMIHSLSSCYILRNSFLKKEHVEPIWKLKSELVMTIAVDPIFFFKKWTAAAAVEWASVFSHLIFWKDLLRYITNQNQFLRAK